MFALLHLPRADSDSVLGSAPEGRVGDCGAFHFDIQAWGYASRPIRPFWVDRECTPVQIGMVPGTIGVITTILGVLRGGTLPAKWGIY